MTRKVLTIAIPTWNRAEILRKSLSGLLPQVASLADDIQLVISDNASDDGTEVVVSNLLAEFPGIKAIFFRQKENTGYYGNFRKCRELSNGKYFWLLSDNEIISDGFILYLVNLLKNSPDVGLAYINTENTGIDFQYKEIPFDQLFDSRNYKLTFISACILLNKKVEDYNIFEDFDGNAFLGFALLLNTRKYSDKALEISGKVYESLPAVVSFNVFKCWTFDIFQCLTLIKDENLFAPESVERMKESILKFVLKDHLLHYKLYNSYYGRDLGSFDDNYSLIDRFYNQVNNFSIIRKIRETPRFVLFSRLYGRKIMNRIRNLIKI